jgi:hypothetical protein
MLRGQNLDGVRVDTSDLSWFGQYKALLLAEGDEAYITCTTGEGKSPSPLE